MSLIERCNLQAVMYFICIRLTFTSNLDVFACFSQSVRKDLRYRYSAYQMRRCSNTDSAVTFNSATHLSHFGARSSAQFEERIT